MGEIATLIREAKAAGAWVFNGGLVRMRTSLVRMRSRIRAQVHAVLAEHRVATPMSDLFGKEGRRLLEELHLPELSQGRLEACL
jgi:hypothetical protein